MAGSGALRALRARGIRCARVDVALSGVILGAGVIELSVADRLPPGGVPVQAAYLVGIALAVLLRAASPEWSAGSYLLATVFVCALSQPYELLSVGLAFTVLPFLYAATLDGKRLWGVLGLLLLAVAIRSLDDPGQDWFARLLDQAWVLQAAVAGLVVRRYRRRADHLGLAAAERARQAVGLERARIARELHDVVGHQVTAMIVTADAARGLLEDKVAEHAGDPGDGRTQAMASAHAALAAIEDTGRQCLTEMRHLVGLLRDSDSAAGPGPDATAPAPPPPGLDRLEDLLRAVRAAGLPVRVAVNGAPRPVSSGASLTAYRVVQESLTNTIRHAGPTKATVRLDWSTDALTIQVDDDGAGTEPVPPAADGSGLAGLRERARIFGGTFTAGPKGLPGHGWTVRAALPVGHDTPPASASAPGPTSDHRPGRAAAAVRLDGPPRAGS